MRIYGPSLSSDLAETIARKRAEMTPADRAQGAPVCITDNDIQEFARSRGWKFVGWNHDDAVFET